MRRPLKREGTTRLCKQRARVLFLFFLSFFVFFAYTRPEHTTHLSFSLLSLPHALACCLTPRTQRVYILRRELDITLTNKNTHHSPKSPRAMTSITLQITWAVLLESREKRPTAGFFNFLIHHTLPDAKAPQGRKIRLLPRQTSEVEADTGQGVLVYVLQVQNSHPYSSFC